MGVVRVTGVMSQEAQPEVGARHEQTLEMVRCSARLCENPIFGACRLYKSLVLLDRIFEKLTFHTI